MKEILRSNNPVELSWATATLEEAGIPVVELDQHTSVIEGSIGAIQRRLMVADENFEQAEQLLQEGPQV